MGQFAAVALDDKAVRPERELLDAFIDMACDLDELRDYRDDDLHGVSPRIVEALGREDRNLDMAALWQLMLRELMRCTEALLTCFACVLVRGGDGPTDGLVKPIGSEDAQVVDGPQQILEQQASRGSEPPA